MKFIYLIIIFLSWNILSAQITINQQELPDRNDSLRYSLAANHSQFNFNQTGTNYVWNYSSLAPISQELGYYESPSNAPIAYQLNFNAFNTDMAHKAADINLFGTELKEIFYYYNKENGKFSEIGVAAKVDGIPVTVNYDSDDILYTYPLQMGDTSYSYSSWDFNVPNLVYVGRTKIRNNQVDGWGQISTPLGTYDCLRIRSDLVQIDTISYDSIPFPIPAITSNITEYIWLTKTHKLPVLIARFDQFNMNVEVKYADNIRSFNSISEENKSNIKIYPNPAKTEIFLDLNNLKENFKVNLYNINSQIIKTFDNCKNINIENISKGLYIIEIISENIVITEKIIIE